MPNSRSPHLTKALIHIQTTPEGGFTILVKPRVKVSSILWKQWHPRSRDVFSELLCAQYMVRGWLPRGVPAGSVLSVNGLFLPAAALRVDKDRPSLDSTLGRPMHFSWFWSLTVQSNWSFYVIPDSEFPPQALWLWGSPWGEGCCLLLTHLPPAPPRLEDGRGAQRGEEGACIIHPELNRVHFFLCCFGLLWLMPSGP